MEQQIEKKQNGGNTTTTVTGILATTGLGGFILQQQCPLESKMVYLAVLAVGAFAAYIVRFFLRLHERQVAKQTETLEVLLMESRLHVKESAAHATAITKALDRICNNGHVPTGGGEPS